MSIAFCTKRRSAHAQRPACSDHPLHRLLCLLCTCSGSDNGEEARDHISYTLKEGLSVVTKFAVTPYQAFWQPESPAYAPTTARLAFYHPTLGDEPYYTSAALAIKPAMQLQVRVRSAVSEMA